MRRLLEIASILALGVSGFVTITAMYGPSAITDVEPMVDPFSSHPSDWGTQARLAAIPVVQLVLYAFGSLLVKYVAALSFPIPTTTDNRFRLQNLAKSMISWVKAEVLILLACIQVVWVQVARGSRSGFPAMVFQGLALIIFATALAHYIAMRRQSP